MGATESRLSSHEDVLLTIAEVAAIMKVSKMTVYRLIHQGDLPAIRQGRSFRVPESAVHAYIKQQYDTTPS
ncbi:helix-turn-helix domain-containing protein [Nocardia sp. NPDC051321]|uniref:helix-turn-helix domain-containing protein n=1 Tax=Nocardia sp. NPDC051321 TaxID=3364323 RepID=UPI00378BA8AA